MNTAPINPTNIFYATDTGITTIPQNSNPNLTFRTQLFPHL